ncbi:Mov34/MPN/PAD-1 family protein [Aliamphritea spongicola]|uniref:Mov34/MPN/PAD-1 family protein n=1 Tax=Aliamphritea spongicola TaxID=707589 RepID=UPI00196AF776|nr:Mov34/MPN/PAD-1 family protein [Aliamphritea spongicola]MBN3563179.1 Mov34/MPN/PAD-1 family protein [Aliamphritea spongicola]
MDKLHKYQQLRFSDKEAGGVLIGYKRSHGIPGSVTHFELTDCSEPDWFDKRSKFGFIRRSYSHLKKIMDAWVASNEEQTYLGEWHTHPEPHPFPSRDDISEWKKNLQGKEAVLIIIGQQSDWIAYWTGSEAVSLGSLQLDI